MSSRITIPFIAGLIAGSLAVGLMAQARIAELSVAIGDLTAIIKMVNTPEGPHDAR